MKNNQKGLSQILSIIVVAVVIIAAVIFFSARRTSQNIPVIQDTSGLNTVTTELDNTDLNAVDKELDQLGSDTSAF